MCVCAQLCPILCDPVDSSPSDFCPWDFPGKNTLPSPGDLPDPGIEAKSPGLAGRFLTTALPGKPKKSDDRASILFFFFRPSILNHTLHGLCNELTYLDFLLILDTMSPAILWAKYLGNWF